MPRKVFRSALWSCPKFLSKGWLLTWPPSIHEYARHEAGIFTLPLTFLFLRSDHFAEESASLQEILPNWCEISNKSPTCCALRVLWSQAGIDSCGFTSLYTFINLGLVGWPDMCYLKLCPYLWVTMDGLPEMTNPRQTSQVEVKARPFFPYQEAQQREVHYHWKREERYGRGFGKLVQPQVANTDQMLDWHGWTDTTDIGSVTGACPVVIEMIKAKHGSLPFFPVVALRLDLRHGFHSEAVYEGSPMRPCYAFLVFSYCTMCLCLYGSWPWMHIPE